MTLLARIEEANNGSTELLVQFIVCGTVVGHVLPETARILLDMSDVFVKRTAALHLRPDLDRSDLTEERTEAVGEVMSKLRAEGLITGWRDELLAITPRFHRRLVPARTRGNSLARRACIRCSRQWFSSRW